MVRPDSSLRARGSTMQTSTPLLRQPGRPRHAWAMYLTAAIVVFIGGLATTREVGASLPVAIEVPRSRLVRPILQSFVLAGLAIGWVGLAVWAHRHKRISTELDRVLKAAIHHPGVRMDGSLECCDSSEQRRERVDGHALCTAPPTRHFSSAGATPAPGAQLIATHGNASECT